MIVARTDLTTRVQSASASRAATEVVAVCACDDNYAMPLTVMLHSAAKNLGDGSHLTVYFIDGGLSESSWGAIRETLRRRGPSSFETASS